MGCHCSSEAREPGQDIRDQYKIGRLLGSGAFGQVRECTHRTNNTSHAVKIMEKCRDRGHWSHENMFRREVALLGNLDHPNIIKYYGFFEDRHFLYAVMEKCEGGELFEQVIKRRKFDESDAATLFEQMLLSVRYIHGFNIVHRDIKAENFLFKTKQTDSDLKLIDFGMSAKLSSKDEMLMEVCGSPHYLAPELVRRNYNCKADMWALGVLLYLLLYGRYPFDGKSTNAIVKDIVSKPIDWNVGTGPPSTEAVDLMQNLLQRKQEARFSAEEALAHKWVVQHSKAAAAPLAMETLLSASRRVSMKRSPVDLKAQKRREELLQELEKDWTARRSGGATGDYRPKPKPEFSRKNHRMCTTPSRIDDSCIVELQKLRMSTQAPPAVSSRLELLSVKEDASRQPTVGTPIYARGFNRSYTVDVAQADRESTSPSSGSGIIVSKRKPVDSQNANSTFQFAKAAMAAAEPNATD